MFRKQDSGTKGLAWKKEEANTIKFKGGENMWLYSAAGVRKIK